MKNQFEKFGYHITTDNAFQNKRYGITPDLERQLESLGKACQTARNRKIIDKLIQLIEKYPNVPMLKNYLSVAYNVLGDIGKAYEVNHWTLKEHPDYLFARLNLVHEYLNNGETEKIPELLGSSLEIKMLYPDREIFHVAEVTSYYLAVIRYCSMTGDLELAENRLEILEEIAPDHPQTEQAKQIFEYLLFNRIKERKEQENKARISPATRNVVPKSGKSKPPVFTHPGMIELYSYGAEIPGQILHELLELPKQTLIPDLELAIKDAIDRYGYFTTREVDLAEKNFPLHAMLLLNELRSEASLPVILDFLEKDDEFLQFWLGDYLTDTIWVVLYNLGHNHLDLLKEFLLKPGIDIYSRSAVADALCQMILHHPEQREIIRSLLSDVLSAYFEGTPESGLIDSDFNGLLLNNLIDCGLKELLPLIRKLFDKKYISIGMAGDYEDVVKHFDKKLKFDPKRKIHSIFEIYNDVINNWASYTEDNNILPMATSTPAKSVKIGRNDPCPCGSGKKYKKCCME
jgi:tetratricopeptide (TPR) repeat protein